MIVPPQIDGCASPTYAIQVEMLRRKRAGYPPTGVFGPSALFWARLLPIYSSNPLKNKGLFRKVVKSMELWAGFRSFGSFSSHRVVDDLK